MLTLTCNKCGKTNENSYTFNNVRFSYIDEKNQLCFVHLCKSCQLELAIALEKTTAVCLKVAKATDWAMHEGIN